MDRRPSVAEPLSHKYTFFFHPLWVWGCSLSIGDVNSVDPSGSIDPAQAICTRLIRRWPRNSRRTSSWPVKT
jgi:hypothetical protein